MRKIAKNIIIYGLFQLYKRQKFENLPAFFGDFLDIKISSNSKIKNTPSASGGANIKILLQLIQESLSFDGDVAECGVYRGATIIPVALWLSQNNIPKKIYGFDSFSGFNEEVLIDMHLGGAPDNEKHVGGFSQTSLDYVLNRINLLGVDENIEIIPGYFKDTLRTQIERSYSFVHLDCDIYQSYLDCLEYFYPRLVEGGILLLDEYNDLHWPGCNQAVNEFLSNKAERLEMIEIDGYQKYFFRKIHSLPYPD